jgi:neutral ceramidase
LGIVRAGISSGDLSPWTGVDLGGYPYVNRRNTGVHDPLHGGALYLNDDSGGSVLLIVTDLFWITRAQADEVRRRVAQRTGLPTDRIVVTCSHSHSAPWMNVVFEAQPGEDPFVTDITPDYIEYVVETCTGLAVDAFASTFKASAGHGLVTCGAESGVGGNRRDPEHGPVDTDVPVLVVKDEAGAIRAIWTKYACHPTILHAENTLVSADFPGAMRQVVAQAYPDAVFLYSMGTAGDQSPRYFRTGQTFDEVERFGGALGRAVVEAVAVAEWPGDQRIGVASQTVELPVKVYPAPEVVAERIATLKARESDLIADGAPYVEQQTANLWLLGAECDYANALKHAAGTLMNRYEASAPFSVTGLVVGDRAWAFLPGEIFSEFGLAIKARSPWPRTHVVTLSNGDLPGYCVTREALAEGGYEPGNSILDPASGDVLTDAAVDLLTTIRNVEERP